MPARLRFVLLALLCACVLASCGDDGSTGSDSGGDSGSSAGATCEYTEDGTPPAKEVEPPPSEATQTGEVDVTIATSAGDVSATLDAEAAPCTVNSFLSLAEQGYFDATTCHRLTTSGIFVLQCGDPTASGAGGPGYSFPDELEGNETYPAGTLARANAGPDTHGSQFFIVYGDAQLPPSYTVFGTISEAGLKVIDDIARAGDDGAYDSSAGGGHPNKKVTITKSQVAA